MSGPEPDALKEWAESHGLAWQPEATLAPVTERLRLGLGIGPRRASWRVTSDRGVTTISGSMRKKPERETVGVTKGRLPGGLEGSLGHHVHLIDQGPGTEDRYLAITDTVVFAELSLRARPVFHLEGRQAADRDEKGAITIGKTAPTEMKGPLDHVVPPAKGVEAAGGMEWTSFPAEPDERTRRIGSGATRFLDGLPVDRIQVEYECGKLAVWVKGRTLTDPGSLDQFCRFASTLAADLTGTADSSPALELDKVLPLPEPDARESWVREGADLVDWEEPPVSIVAAQERYKKDVKPKATRTGWKVYGIVAAVLFFFSVLVALASLGASLLTDQLPLGLGVMVAMVSVAGGALAANKVALLAGQEALDDRLVSSATPWGIEAFAVGYARHAGLVREDHDELRRRLEVPFNGRPQIAWQGELASGIPGHLSSWIDATNTPEPPRFYLLAVTAANGSATPPGYQSREAGGQRLTWQEVTSVQRAVHRLDQLRDTAAK